VGVRGSLCADSGNCTDNLE